MCLVSTSRYCRAQWALGYMAASGLIGLAVTYYYDDPANEKLNTILKTGLQLVGLAMVSLSTAAPEVSVGVAAALALSHVVRLPQCEVDPFCIPPSLSGATDCLEIQT